MKQQPDRRSQKDRQADNLIKYFEQRAKRGNPEARRDWLYAPALVPGGAWNSDELLDEVIRHAKDRGAEREPRFELVYVYRRPPVWTCEPTEWVRDRAQIMELKREYGAHERWERCVPANSVNAGVAGGAMLTLSAAQSVLEARSPEAEPVNDPVLARIDAQGIAN